MITQELCLLIERPRHLVSEGNMRTLMWFREDLRVEDNTALYYAAKEAKEGVIAVFFVSPKLWKQKGYGNGKIDFIIRNANELAKSLKQKNISFIVEKADSHQAIQHNLLTIISKNKIDSLYFNRRYYDFNDIQDEKVLLKRLEKQNTQVFSFNDEAILPPGSVLTQKNEFYSVFTPFKNQWIKVFQDKKELLSLKKVKKQKKQLIKSGTKVLQLKITSDKDIQKKWPAGEKEAKKRLNTFIKNRIKTYHIDRDYPSIQGTSELSPYLALGIISPRTCLKAALKANNNQIIKGEKGILIWVSELIWRDFYKHIIVGFPRLNRHEPFKQYTKKIKWKNNKALLKKWREGKTGFPIVDAAMRQLNHTGWMHNRLRMIVASFLAKLLLIDWREGEAYFAKQLIDYDFAANNGGWQWSASTGADAMPYFRLFNPELQSKKFDPKGKFIKQYCPEYEALTTKEIHHARSTAILDYKKAKKKALLDFKKSL